MPAARKQISLIHVAKSSLSLTDDMYRAILRQAAGVESSRELDGPGFQHVMDQFAKLGFRSDYRMRNCGQRAGMASPARIELIRALWIEYTDGKGDEPALLGRGFFERVLELQERYRPPGKRIFNGLQTHGGLLNEG